MIANIAVSKVYRILILVLVSILIFTGFSLTANAFQLTSIYQPKTANSWYAHPQGLTNLTPAIAGLSTSSGAPATRLAVVHVGQDSGIYAGYSTNNIATEFSAWTKLQGSTTQPVALAGYGNQAYLVHRGDDKGIYLASSLDGGVSFGNWTKINGQTDKPISLTVSNAPGQFNGRICLAHIGLDTKIYSGCTDVFNSNTRSSLNISWREFGGETTEPVSLSVFNNQLNFLHRGNDSNIYTRNCGLTPRIELICGNWSGIEGSTPTALTQTTYFEYGTPPSNFVEALLQLHRGGDNNVYTKVTTRSNTGFSPYAGWERLTDSDTGPVPVTNLEILDTSYDGHVFFFAKRSSDNKIYFYQEVAPSGLS
jgi:hypothetical protein